MNTLSLNTQNFDNFAVAELSFEEQIKTEGGDNSAVPLFIAWNMFGSASDLFLENIFGGFVTYNTMDDTTSSFGGGTGGSATTNLAWGGPNKGPSHS